MEFSEIVVKDNPGLCRCCLSEGCYKDMGSDYTWMNETEIYADMLLECFDISISQHNEGPNGPNRLICEVCITRLRDACYFKKQVLDSEKKFVDMVGRGEFKSKVVVYQTQMKAETAEEAAARAEDTDGEYLDDDMAFVDDELDQKHDESEVAASSVTADPLPVRNKRGRPKKATTTKSTKKKVKVEKNKNKALVKGTEHCEAFSAAINPNMTSTKRNRLMKRNAILVLENSTATPFKWQRHQFLCFFCHMPFATPRELIEHTNTDHKKSNIKSAVDFLRRDEKVKIDIASLHCNCGTRYDDLNLLISHLEKDHAKTFTEGCGYGLIPYRLNDSTFYCAICNEEFQYFMKLNQHMNDHYGSYVCETCGKSFLSQDRLRSHSHRHGAGYKCNKCSQCFDSLTQRNNHETNVHNIDKKVKCYFCPETFSNYKERKIHRSSVHNLKIPEFKCPDCGKIFHIMSKMKVHLKEVHIREKNFSCTICDQRFFSKSHVQKHMIKHFGEKVFQCNVCMKSYPRKQTLRDHMRIHSNEKRFICSVCSQGFVQNSSLRLHLNVHHPECDSI